jgi:hypothetical protein
MIHPQVLNLREARTHIRLRGNARSSRMHAPEFLLIRLNMGAPAQLPFREVLGTSGPETL